jgi:phage terminase small subunit
MSGPLTGARHESFCQAMVRGANQADAVRIAGYNTKQPSQQDHFLLLREDVQTRIARLKLELGTLLREEIEEESAERTSLSQ